MSSWEIENLLLFSNGNDDKVSKLLDNLDIKGPLAGPRKKKIRTESGEIPIEKTKDRYSQQRKKRNVLSKIVTPVPNAAEFFLPQKCLDETWTMGEMIGEGTFGKVYRVEPAMEYVEQQFALKRISFHIDYHPEEKEKLFRKEVFFSLKASELGVGPDIFDYGTCISENGRGFHFMIMEMLGRTWKDISDIRGPAIDADKYNAQSFVQVLEMVYKLNENGIHHGDLNPQNIMTKVEDGRADSGLRFYFIDFGLTDYSTFYQKTTYRQPRTYLGILGNLLQRLSLNRGLHPEQVPFENTEEYDEFYQDIEDGFFKKHWPNLYSNE